MIITVKNIKGSSKEKYKNQPRKYSSWLNYWEDNSPHVLPTCCSCDACNNNVEVGAHVMKEGVSYSNEWYIVPLCQECNMKDEFFKVDEDYLVKLN